MTVLPIVARELRVSARRWGTYVLRMGAATSAIALAAMIYWFVSRDSGSRPADMGKIIFGVLNGFAFLYALLIGVRVSSDCISSERREGTLGLLFLTDLKGLDIVLGKLAASALDSFYALVSTLPVMAIPILLGSVTPGEIWRAAISLLSTALFSVCAGMFVSAFSVNERKATAGTFLLIICVTAGLPLVVLLLSAYLHVNDELQWLFAFSPGTGMVTALVNNPVAIPWEMYWTSVSFTLFYAVACAGVAALVVPRTWQQRVEDKSRFRSKGVDRDAEVRRAERQQLLEISPTCWLGSRGRLRGVWIWVFLGCLSLGWLWAYVEDPSMMLALGMNAAWMFFAHGVIKVFVASDAVRIYAEEIQQGALELILCTPLTVSEIVRGQILSVVRCFRWPILLVLVADGLFLFIGRVDNWSGAETSVLSRFFVAMMVFFMIDCAAITLVGLWQGLVSRNSRQALTSTAVRILVLPWIMFGLLNLFAAVVLDRGIPASLQLSVLVALSLLIDGLFAWQAWEQLHQNVRRVAASRYGGRRPSSWWTVLGRMFGKLGARRKTA